MKAHGMTAGHCFPPKGARLGCTIRVNDLQQSWGENGSYTTVNTVPACGSPCTGAIRVLSTTAARDSLHNPITSGAGPTSNAFPCVLAMLKTLGAADSLCQRNTVVTPSLTLNTTPIYSEPVGACAGRRATALPGAPNAERPSGRGLAELPAWRSLPRFIVSALQKGDSVDSAERRSPVGHWKLPSPDEGNRHRNSHPAACSPVRVAGSSGWRLPHSAPAAPLTPSFQGFGSLCPAKARQPQPRSASPRRETSLSTGLGGSLRRAAGAAFFGRA